MASQAPDFEVRDCGSIAASGSGNYVVQVPSGTDKLAVFVGVKYAAVAGTSGVTAALSFSVDGGSTYNASAAASAVLKPAAAGFGNATLVVGINDIATRRDAGSITHYKVTLTNADATNAAAYVVGAKPY